MKLNLDDIFNSNDDENQLISLAKENPEQFLHDVKIALSFIEHKPTEFNPIIDKGPGLDAEESPWAFLPALSNYDWPELNWVWEDNFIEGGLSLLAAAPKTGKSTFIRNLMLKVSKGESFLGYNTIKSPVIYVSLEDMRQPVIEHFVRLGAHNEAIWVYDGLGGDWYGDVYEKALDVGPGLIVIDTLGKAYPGRKINEYEVMQECFLEMQKMARETRSHVCVVHHTNKNEVASGGNIILGSQAIGGATDANFFLIKDRQEVRSLKSHQRYGKDIIGLKLTYDPTTGEIKKASLF